MLGLGFVIYRRYFSHIDIFATSNVALIIIIYSLCSSSLLIINKARVLLVSDALTSASGLQKLLTSSDAASVPSIACAPARVWQAAGP